MSAATRMAAPAPAPGALAVQLKEVVFRWHKALAPVLDIPEFTLARGERLFLFGPSGCGKTTLLGVIAGVLRVERGIVRVLEQSLETLPASQVDVFRAQHIGFIFQMFNLLPYLSVVENVMLPARFCGLRLHRTRERAASARDEALRLLAELGLRDQGLLARPVTELSVGQQQRVAAARALYGAPEIVIADEPTSSLDQDAKEGFLRLLFDECERTSSSLLFVSHDRTLARLFDRALGMDSVNRATGRTSGG